LPIALLNAVVDKLRSIAAARKEPLRAMASTASSSISPDLAIIPPIATSHPPLSRLSPWLSTATFDPTTTSGNAPSFLRQRRRKMAVELPRTIADYFAADSRDDAGALTRCFADGAVVKDEGHTYTGHDAIRRWKAEASTKYTYTVEPFAIIADGDRAIVTSHVVGDFPGSPTDLRYHFVLAGEKITELEIVA
jgi:ketosteroid isomerase-like protein